MFSDDWRLTRPILVLRIANRREQTMFTLAFWKDAAERAVKTFAQSLLALLTVGATITSIDWVSALEISATATVLSLLTSVVSLPIGNSGTASLVKAPTTPPTS
jgi:hypothetical protein